MLDEQASATPAPGYASRDGEYRDPEDRGALRDPAAGVIAALVAPGDTERPPIP